MTEEYCWAVMLRPIRFRCAGVWISTAHPSIYICIVCLCILSSNLGPELPERNWCVNRRVAVGVLGPLKKSAVVLEDWMLYRSYLDGSSDASFLPKRPIYTHTNRRGEYNAIYVYSRTPLIRIGLAFRVNIRRL